MVQPSDSPARSPHAEPSAGECEAARDNPNTVGGGDGARGGVGTLTREQLETLA